MASKKIIGGLIIMAVSLFMTTVIARDIEISSNLHAGGVRCHRYCGPRCCTEEEIRNLEHNSKVKPDVEKKEAATAAQNEKAADPNFHESGSGRKSSTNLHAVGVRSCRRYCGPRCCTEEEIQILEQNPTAGMVDAQKPEASTVQDNEAAPEHHHEGGSHHCYKYCGPHHRCCMEEEIRNLERSQKCDGKCP